MLLPSRTETLSNERPSAHPGWSRRQWLLATGATSLLGAMPAAHAQPVSAAAEEAQAPPMPAVGSTLELPRIERLDGSVYEPAASAGQPLLVYWWSSTCPFCALQSPEMQKLWAAQSGRGLQVLALSIDQKAEDARAYLQKRGYTFPAVWLSPDLARAYPKPDGLPVTVVRGKDGRVAQAEKGQLFAEDVAELARWL